MPVKVEDLVPEILDVVQASVSLMLFEAGIGAVVGREDHLGAVLNYGIALCDEVEDSMLRVVDADLVRADVQVAAQSLVHEGGSAYATCKDLTVLEVLRVQALDLEGKVDLAVLEILKDDVLFALILSLCLTDLTVTQVLDVEVIGACHLLRRLLDCLLLFLNWLLGRRLLPGKGKLLFGQGHLLLLIDGLIERVQVSLVRLEVVRHD